MCLNTFSEANFPYSVKPLIMLLRGVALSMLIVTLGDRYFIRVLFDSNFSYKLPASVTQTGIRLHWFLVDCSVFDHAMEYNLLLNLIHLISDSLPRIFWGQSLKYILTRGSLSFAVSFLILSGKIADLWFSFIVHMEVPASFLLLPIKISICFFECTLKLEIFHILLNEILPLGSAWCSLFLWPVKACF